MQELGKKAATYALIGFGLYSVGCTIISTVIATNKIGDGKLYVMDPGFAAGIGNPLLAFILEMLATGLFGAVVMAGIVVYEIERWSLLRATVTHYVLWILMYYSVGFFLRWISIHEAGRNLMFLVLWTAMYFVIWLIEYTSYKAEIKEINAELINLKKTENENAA